jgi:hypothetical protein
LKKIEKKPLATAATLVVVAGGILAAVYALGEFALGRMMADDALTIADLWSRSLDRDGRGLEATLAGTSEETLASTLHIAKIDRVVLIPAGRNPIVVHGPNADAELKQVVAGNTGGERPLYEVASGSYTLDSVSWLGQTPFHSWVILPPERTGRVRLALRVDQTSTAADMISSFAREVLFSGGVAIITFISFMAGFSYRQRQLSAENAAIRFLALHDELTAYRTASSSRSSRPKRSQTSKRAATRRRSSRSISTASRPSTTRSAIRSATGS